MNQQDAPELFRYFIEGLIWGENEIMKKRGQLVQDKTSFKKIETPTEKVFGTYQAHRVTCLHCDYISWTFHMSIDLNIDIDKEELRHSRSINVEEKENAFKKLEEEENALKKRVKNGNYLLD